ncbi:molybdopterin-binding protein [Methylobacterium sp. Leaf466]|uniref:molybdopterin-binding protein n=1 Tax=Methylobacterium sp. Leaf466 TaxID=1736386 RepID=UPI001FCDFCB8|nr:molybdopterin-binding protein [Methylobacterium sp. Leaf466]
MGSTDRPAAMGGDGRRSASSALTPLDAACRRLLAGVAHVMPLRRDLAAAIGVRMAADVLVPAGCPAVPLALRDGWAVAAEAVAGAGPYSPVLLVRRPEWVEAGNRLPVGADTVLDPEAVPDTPDPMGRIAVVADAAGTDGTRQAGGDLGGGDVLVAAGTRLTPLQSMALVACGIAAVEVRSPAVALIATGAHAAPVCRGLAGLIAADGARVVAVLDAPDEAQAIADAILAASADAVLVVGGTGFGRTDRSAAGLAAAGTVAVHGIALRPGESAGFGSATGRPVVLIPGRPEAALAAYLALVRPLLDTLSGAVAADRPTAPLTRKVVSAPGVSDIVFVRREAGGLVPLGGAEIPLHRLCLADAAVLVPPEREGYGEGTTVPFIPL